MATEKKQSFEAALTARIMRQNYMLMGPKLFAALPPWTHALQWHKGAPTKDDMEEYGAVIGAVVSQSLSPQNGQMQFHVSNNPHEQTHHEYVMWASLYVLDFQGQLPLWLQFKTP